MVSQRLGNNTLSPAGRSLPGVGQVSSLDILAPIPAYYAAATGQNRIQQPGVGQMVETGPRSELDLFRRGIGTETANPIPLATGEVAQPGVGDLLRTRQRTALPGATLPSESIQVGAGTDPLTQSQTLVPATPLGDVSAAQDPASLALQGGLVSPSLESAIAWTPEQVAAYEADVAARNAQAAAAWANSGFAGGGGGGGGGSVGGGFSTESAAPMFQPAPQALPITQQTATPQFVQGPVAPPPVPLPAFNPAAAAYGTAPGTGIGPTTMTPAQVQSILEQLEVLNQNQFYGYASYPNLG